MAEKIPAHIREQQINELPNISFVRWEGVYKGVRSKAVCRCEIDGYEWHVSVANIINNGRKCPQCSVNRFRPAEERIDQINSLPNISFVRWDGDYKNCDSNAFCRCSIDGYEWSVRVSAIVYNKNGCPQCAGLRRWTAEERIAQINERPNISFVRWENCFKNQRSKAVCRCAIDNFEWAATVTDLMDRGSGCPQCATRGYSIGKPGALYILRSECGSMVKIGISNNYKRRHIELRRATPFAWSCIELIHSDDGAFIAKAEKELHSLTEQAQFSEPFDGYTEWRKWDDMIPMLIEEYRARA